jgi:TPR repeat protein
MLAYKTMRTLAVGCLLLVSACTSAERTAVPEPEVTSVAARAKLFVDMPLPDLERNVADGDISALVELGVRYATGRGVEKDEARALEMFERGVAAGDASAMYAMGVAFANGAGVPQDDAIAVHWYQRAADLDFGEAQFWLANMVSAGRGGISQTWTGAYPLYLKAAEKNQTEAQFIVGWMLQTGTGVDADPERAAFWYRRSSAIARNPKAEWNLSSMIANGDAKWRKGDPDIWRPGKAGKRQARSAQVATPGSVVIESQDPAP